MQSRLNKSKINALGIFFKLVKQSSLHSRWDKLRDVAAERANFFY